MAELRSAGDLIGSFVSILRETISGAGRLRRSAFWSRTWPLLAVWALVSGFVVALKGAGSDIPTLAGWWAATAALLLLSLGAQVRRLHDRGLSGWWLAPVPMLLGLLVLQQDAAPPQLAALPAAYLAWLLAQFCLPGTPTPNRFGPVPSRLSRKEQLGFQAQARAHHARRADQERLALAYAEAHGVTVQEATHMAPLGITPEDGRYRHGDRLFDSLGDAVTYAIKLQRYRVREREL